MTSHLSEFTDQELVDRAVAALTEIENRWRKTQPGVRLPIIRAVLDFRNTIHRPFVLTVAGHISGRFTTHRAAEDELNRLERLSQHRGYAPGSVLSVSHIIKGG